MQSETGLALVYLSFFIVMYREGLPSAVLIIGFSVGALVVATLLLKKTYLALILTGIAVFVIYIMRRQIKRDRSLLVNIVLLWVTLCRYTTIWCSFYFQTYVGKTPGRKNLQHDWKDIPKEYKKEQKNDQAKGR